MKEKTCTTCKGSKMIDDPQQGYDLSFKKCPDCGGTGVMLVDDKWDLLKNYITHKSNKSTGNTVLKQILNKMNKLELQ